MSLNFLKQTQRTPKISRKLTTPRITTPRITKSVSKKRTSTNLRRISSKSLPKNLLVTTHKNEHLTNIPLRYMFRIENSPIEEIEYVFRNLEKKYDIIEKYLNNRKTKNFRFS